MLELADALDLLAHADQLAHELLSVPDTVPGSLPPFPVPPMSDESKQAADEEYERIRDAAASHERGQGKTSPWERFKDGYKRTGDNIIDQARQWIDDDIRSYREKQAEERFWQDTSKQLHQKYPHGHNP